MIKFRLSFQDYSFELSVSNNRFSVIRSETIANKVNLLSTIHIFMEVKKNFAEGYEIVTTDDPATVVDFVGKQTPIVVFVNEDTAKDFIENYLIDITWGRDAHLAILSSGDFPSIEYGLQDSFILSRICKTSCLAEVYHFDPTDLSRSGGVIICDGSGLNFRFAKYCFAPAGYEVISVPSKNNILAEALNHLDQDVIILTDLCSLGNCCWQLPKVCVKFKNIHLYNSLSFELELLLALRSVYNLSVPTCNISLYSSVQEFYEAVLVDWFKLMFGFPYSKNNLAIYDFFVDGMIKYGKRFLRLQENDKILSNLWSDIPR